MTDEFDSDIQNQDDPYLLKIDLQNCRDQWHEHALKQGLEIGRLRAENEKLATELEHEEGQVDRLNGLLVEQYNTCRCRALAAQLGRAKVLLEDTSCGQRHIGAESCPHCDGLIDEFIEAISND